MDTQARRAALLPAFVAQPSGFYESAYSRRDLLAAECSRDSQRAQHLHVRRPWRLVKTCLFIDPLLLPNLATKRCRA